MCALLCVCMCRLSKLLESIMQQEENKVRWYCKSGNFGQWKIFGKRKKTPFGKKNFSVLHTLAH